MVNADIKKFLPPHLIEVFGKNLPALYNAINSNNAKTETLIQACIDNIFLSTASGKYLVNLGEEAGFSLPANSGLDSNAYKALVPVMVSDAKQVRISIQELIRVFYGSDRTKPNITSSVIGPYSLSPGDNLLIETESGTINVTLFEGQVSDFSNVTAGELSAIINYTQDTVLGDIVLDKVSGNSYLRIASKTPGTGAYIKVVGGTLQNVLKFPTLVDTNFTTQTFSLSKIFTYSDELTITWNGIGTNPLIFLCAPGDVLTVRGFTDSINPYSQLNGSFEIVDVGYDYIKVRNNQFDVTSDTITLSPTETFVVTSNRKSILFDQSEYAFITETNNQSITVTVPAIPPLAKRFLKGSAHLQGGIFNVLNITRNSIQILITSQDTIPNENNLFVLESDTQRPDFTRKKYKTVVSNQNPTNPIYTIETANNDYAELPHTVPTIIGTNPIYGEIDSHDYKITFLYKHGLFYTWGFTLASATGSSNVTGGMLNQEQKVRTLLSDNELLFGITSGGVEIPFEGLDWGNVGFYPSIYRHSSAQPDGSDFYMTFPNITELNNSELIPGRTFKIDATGGTVIDSYLTNYLRYKKLVVTSVSGLTVNFSVGLGVGAGGLVVQDIYGKRSGYFGGTPTYFFDQSSNHNVSRVLSNLKAIFVNYTQSKNPEYKGSFLFDPQGATTFVTVSRFTTTLANSVLKGDNPTDLIVNSLQSNVGEDFPKTGKIVISYGSKDFEGPINYYSTLKNLSQNQILIDQAYKFKKTHKVGSSVTYIHDTKTYIPSQDGSDLPAYMTGTVQARNTLFNLIELLVAAGIFVEKDVLYPDLVYDDVSIPVFE